jgi:hypothetical protein
MGSVAKAAKRSGGAAHRIGQYLVGLPGKRYGDLRRQRLGPRSRDRQDLHVHASGIHPGQTILADVEQAQVDLSPPDCSSC